MNHNPGVHKIELRQPKKAFALIPNQAVRDPELTANSFRLLAYLLSHNDGYELTYRQIEIQTGLGRYAINAASKQLTAKGWLRVEQTKLANGQFGPKSWTLLSPGANEPAAGESIVDEFHSGTADGLKKTTTKEDNSLEKTITKKAMTADDYQPSPGLLEELGGKFPHVSLDVELEKFRDHHMAKGSKFSIWDRAFRKWIAQAAEWNQPKRVSDKPTPGPGRREWVKPYHRSGDHWACEPGEFPEGCGA